MVSNCETCLKFSAVILWTKFVRDIFTFHNCDYFLMVDYMSKFPIFCKLLSMTTRVVTEMIKSIFSVHDKPTTIASENGPCYSFEYFAKEMAKWEIYHITSPSPKQCTSWGSCEDKQSNPKKGKRWKWRSPPDNVGKWTTLISPTTPSPMELTHGCKPRGDLPKANAVLRAKSIVVEVAKSLKNQQTSDENQFIEGQAVMYKTPPEKIWKKPKVIKYVGHQSYLIHADDGAVYRHTRFYLKPYTAQ